MGSKQALDSKHGFLEPLRAAGAIRGSVGFGLEEAGHQLLDQQHRHQRAIQFRRAVRVLRGPDQRRHRHGRRNTGRHTHLLRQHPARDSVLRGLLLLEEQ